ncbi:unnamed protein product [Miscanthus lutarioriparius]|uniref:DOG1 domain-containing protein n=1 Tax=Miscanthus lutarioriparius TaxID=422564 RepID=A0A811SS83_9POAL|nr:unnamed protein product [Miscanthus lutarioriparius]
MAHVLFKSKDMDGGMSRWSEYLSVEEPIPSALATWRNMGVDGPQGSSASGHKHLQMEPVVQLSKVDKFALDALNENAEGYMHNLEQWILLLLDLLAFREQALRLILDLSSTVITLLPHQNSLILHSFMDLFCSFVRVNLFSDKMPRKMILQVYNILHGIFLGGAPGANTSSGAAMFDVEYARWLDDHGRRMAELHGALHAHLPDADLRAIVDDTLTHHDELFQLKASAAKSDVFHLRATLLPQLDPLTEQQLVGICNLQQSSQQAEEALSQGLDQLHQSLADTMAGGSLIDDTNMSFMGQMALALGKLSNLEGFVIQADNLRQQTLHQMHRILTVRQAARCFLAIGEYHNRLRALSSPWVSRPREILVADEGSCGEISIAAQASQSQFSSF